MSYFKRGRRVPEKASKPACYGIDFDPMHRNCREACADRFDCAELCGAGTAVKVRTIKPSSKTASAAEDDDYETVDPAPTDTLGKIYMHNASLGVAEAAVDELLFLIREAPRKKYRFKSRDG